MPPSLPYRAPTPSSPSSFGPCPSLADELRYLIRSTQPAIVFSSLAHLCVPIFSDECTVEIVEDGVATYRISYPRPDPGPEHGYERPPAHSSSGDRAKHGGYAVRTRFTSTGYAGMVTHLWRTRVPTPADVSWTLKLVRRGMDTVRAERQDGHGFHDDGGHDT